MCLDVYGGRYTPGKHGCTVEVCAGDMRRVSCDGWFDRREGCRMVCEASDLCRMSCA